MSVTAASTEEESFIVLGSSPDPSLPSARYSGPEGLRIDEAMKDFSAEASLAFKAHFHLSDTPSPRSMLAAESIVSSARGSGELQARVGELLDENVLLKETLRTNNDSLKERFLLIASCQEDVMRTHRLHKDKFRETRELVERLRSENRKLKEENRKLSGSKSSLQGSLGASSPVASLEGAPADAQAQGEPSLAYEFVASPDEDTLHKLTTQLELVEKQRRQVIVENEKLTWQKESLEHMVDVTSKERDELRQKLNTLELEHMKKESGALSELQTLRASVKDLQARLLQAESLGSMGGEELTRRDGAIGALEAKVSALQAELKTAQLKILQMEDLKLEVSRLKSAGAEAARVYRQQLHDLQQRLREAHTTVFQPVRFSVSSEREAPGAEQDGCAANVKLYDQSLKHLAELLNTLTAGSLESASCALQLAAQAAEARAEPVAADARGVLARLRGSLEGQHAAAIAATGQVRATISIFEKIFQDYKDVLKDLQSAKREPTSASMDALTAALVSRDQELQLSAAEVTRLRAATSMLQGESDEREHLRAQVEAYKADFEAERESREKMASDKDTVMSELRGLQQRNQTLTEQLEEVRRLNPNIFLSATTKRPAASRPRSSSTAPAAFNMVYTCPKCQTFTCDQYKVIEDHVQVCLDM